MFDQAAREQLITMLTQHGIMLSLSDQENFLDIAGRCFRHAGIRMGGGVGLMTSGAGAVMVPGVGAVPGWLLGFIAGAISGTGMCVMMNYGMREEIVKLVREARGR